MTTRKKRILIPAAFVFAAGCTPAMPKKCGTEPSHACWPDGGFACPEECGGIKESDGGLKLDSMGQPTCLC